jgi:hypothetical protein
MARIAWRVKQVRLTVSVAYQGQRSCGSDMIESLGGSQTLHKIIDLIIKIVS